MEGGRVPQKDVLGPFSSLACPWVLLAMSFSRSCPSELILQGRLSPAPTQDDGTLGFRSCPQPKRPYSLYILAFVRPSSRHHRVLRFSPVLPYLPSSSQFRIAPPHPQSLTLALTSSVTYSVTPSPTPSPPPYKLPLPKRPYTPTPAGTPSASHRRP